MEEKVMSIIKGCSEEQIGRLENIIDCLQL